MIQFPTQEFRHDPDNGSYGDCMRTSIACVLGLARDDVPHFAFDGDRGEVFAQRQRDFLASRGLRIVTVAYGPDLDYLLRCTALWNPDVWWILGGTSGSGENHAVVCQGGEIVHDPHPDAVGIVAPSPGGQYWCDFLTHIGPDAA